MSTKKKIKNTALCVVTAAAFVIVFGLSIETSDNVPLAVLLYAAALAWLFLFGVANDPERQDKNG